jgi:hypothetical protein
MSDSTDRLFDYGLCSKCSHRRPVSKLKNEACADQTLCAALKARRPANPPDPYRALMSPPDWGLVPDPPLVRGTQYHRTKNGELAAVTAYSNGKSNGGGNGHG